MEFRRSLEIKSHLPTAPTLENSKTAGSNSLNSAKTCSAHANYMQHQIYPQFPRRDSQQWICPVTWERASVPLHAALPTRIPC